MDEPDSGLDSLARRTGSVRPPLPQHRAGRRLDQPRDDRRKCGLTCPVLSQQSNDLALINFQLDTGKDLIGVETFRDSTDGQSRHRTLRWARRIVLLGNEAGRAHLDPILTQIPKFGLVLVVVLVLDASAFSAVRRA